MAVPQLFYHTCLICLCWAAVNKEMSNNILHFKKEDVVSFSLCAQSDLQGLTEICVTDTDVTSLGGPNLHTTSFVLPRASSQSQQ